MKRVPCAYGDCVSSAFAKAGLVALPVKDFPDYAVTTSGDVFSRRHASGPLGYFTERKRGESGRFPKNYAAITLCSDNKRIRKKIHRIVAETFIPQPKGAQCVRHLNGDRFDNRLANLAWGTFQDNENDKRGHGTWGARFSGKLSEDQVRWARKQKQDGQRAILIAAALGVDRRTVNRAINGDSWRHVK